MLGTATAILTTIFAVALVRRWLLGVTHRKGPTEFCSWLSAFMWQHVASTAVFARYGCDYLAWVASLYCGDFSVTLMFRTCDTSPVACGYTKCRSLCAHSGLPMQVLIPGLSRVCTSFHTSSIICVSPPARRGAVHREKLRFASGTVGGWRGAASRHPAQSPVPQDAH